MRVFVFEAGGSFIYVKLEEKRLFFSGVNTGYNWLSLRKLAEDTQQDTAEVELVEHIAASIADDKLELYIKNEFKRMGLLYIKSIGADDYDKLTAEQGS